MSLTPRFLVRRTLVLASSFSLPVSVSFASLSRRISILSASAALSVSLLAISVLGISIVSVTSTVAADHVIALTTDFSTGSVSTCDLTPPWNTDIDVASICPDAVARYYGGLVYVVSRFGCDNIHVLDPGNGYSTVRQFSVGIGNNPQDIALVSPTRAYVSCYETEWLLEVNPATGAIVDSVSLGLFADADGIPEMHRMLIWQNRLFIQIQRLDRNNSFEPTDASYLAVLNLSTRELIDVNPNTGAIDPIVLAGKNPSSPMEIDWSSGGVLVPTSGRFLDVTDGGIERVDPFRLRTRGFIVRESDLGGNLLHFTQWQARRAFAVISDESFVTCLVAFDPHTGDLLDDLYCSDGFELGDCVTASEGYLYVADRDFFEPGIRVFDPGSGVDLSGALPVGLPPIELLVFRPAVSEVPEADLAGATSAFPNPASTKVTVRMQRGSEMSPSLDTWEAAIFDAAGRHVRQLEFATADGGEWVAVWNLRDDSGDRVPAGIYWARAGAGSGATMATHSITVLD